MNKLYSHVRLSLTAPVDVLAKYVYQVLQIKAKSKVHCLVNLTTKKNIKQCWNELNIKIF